MTGAVALFLANRYITLSYILYEIVWGFLPWTVESRTVRDFVSSDDAMAQISHKVHVDVSDSHRRTSIALKESFSTLLMAKVQTAISVTQYVPWAGTWFLQCEIR